MGKKGYGSCFGKTYQQYDKYITKYINNYFGNVNINVLIPNALDGLHVLCSARKGYNVDCYETNNVLINGGVIDNFNIVGLKEKIEYFNLNDKINLFECNFFEQKVEREYDFVFCYKALSYDINKDITIERKMRKLLSSVKENGFIYIYYHLAKKDADYINYPKNSYFRRLQMREYFDDSWEIIDIIENSIPSKENAHPFNNEEHLHLAGHVFARKKYKRRKYKYTYKISVKI